MTPAEIKSIRDNLKLSQGQIAPLLGYANALSISQLETGFRKPSGAVMLLLKAYRGKWLPIDWLETQDTVTLCSGDENPAA